MSTSRHDNSGANSGAESGSNSGAGPQADQQAPNHRQWIDDWLRAQQAWLAQWQQAASNSAQPPAFDAFNLFARQFNAAPDAVPDAAAHAAEMLRGWQAWLQAPGTAGAQSFQAPAFWQQIMQAANLWPGVRQAAWQAQHTAFEAAGKEYAARLQTVLQAHARVFSQSLATLQAQLQQGTLQPQNMRELYDLWVTGGEQAFAQLAHDEAFITAQAQMINALTRLQIARNAMLEEWLKGHDLPTRSELNAMQARLHELHELKGRIEALERQLASKHPA